ncbi:helix-turn-helix domain-containing protein [Larkinella arboricola]
MNKGRVIYEDEAEPHFRLAYPHPGLTAFVEYYFEVNQPATLANPLYLNALPNLSNLLCVSLRPQSWLSINQKSGALSTVKGSRFLGNLTDLHLSIYPASVHEFYVKFKPGLLGKLFRINPAEVENANADLVNFIPLPELEEHLQTAPSFRQRVSLMEQMLMNRLYGFIPDYRFAIVQTALNRFGQTTGDNYHLNQICRELGVSYPSLHRYFTEVLGYSPKYCQKLLRFKKGLHLYKRHGSGYSFEEIGYTDFSHFVKDSRQLTQRSPSDL